MLAFHCNLAQLEYLYSYVGDGQLFTLQKIEYAELIVIFVTIRIATVPAAIYIRNIIRQNMPGKPFQ